MFAKSSCFLPKGLIFPSKKMDSAGNPSTCTSCLGAEVHPGAKRLGFFSARPVFPVRLHVPQSPKDTHHGRCTRHSGRHRILQFLMGKPAWPETSAIRRQWEPEGPETHTPTWYRSGIAFSEKGAFPQQGHPFSKDSKKGQCKQEWEPTVILSLPKIGNSIR